MGLIEPEGGTFGLEDIQRPGAHSNLFLKMAGFMNRESLFKVYNFANVVVVVLVVFVVNLFDKQREEKERPGEGG